MKSKKLRDAFTYVSDENLDRADTYRKVRNPKWVRWTALAACLCLIVGISLWQRPGGSMGIIASADYSAYHAGHLDKQEISALRPFLQETTAQLLSDTDGENVIYSPLNVYMGLSMLAESSEGESRGQLMDVLGVDSVQTLRSRAGDLWRANYDTEENNTSLLANSLWLDESLDYVEDGVQELARDYYASVFRGEMGSNKYNAMLQDWLNEQTKNYLKKQVDGVEMDSETLLGLMSTVYFEAHWMDEFLSRNNDTKTFTKADGSSVTCEFMNEYVYERFYHGDSFDAVALPLTTGGKMWFVLPREGCTPETVAQDTRLTELLTAPNDWGDVSSPEIHFSVPKFDLSSELDLADGLKALGVTDIFDGNRSDFSPILTGGHEAAVSEAKHAARVSIDEKGVIAAAYFEALIAEEAAEYDDEVDFVLDRPFLFAITSRDDLPLFLGVVNDPTDK